jgi:hypothetical protein
MITAEEKELLIWLQGGPLPSGEKIVKLGSVKQALIAVEAKDVPKRGKGGHTAVKYEGGGLYPFPSNCENQPVFGYRRPIGEFMEKVGIDLNTLLVRGENSATVPSAEDAPAAVDKKESKDKKKDPEKK